MTLGQGHDTTSGMDNNCVKYYPDLTLQWGYGLNKDFRYMCTVTLTLVIWPWVKVKTHPYVMEKNVWNGIQIKLGSEEIWPWGIYALWNWPWRYDLGSRSWRTIGSRKYYPHPILQWRVMARTRSLDMCALWPWPWGYDLGSRLWHSRWSWTTIV